MIRERGFTLLEILGSIGLLALLLLLVAGSFTTANRTVESTSRFAERLDEVRASQRFLREALQNTKAVPAAKDNELVFDGGIERFRFTAPVPLDLGGRLATHQLESFRTSDGELQLRVAFSQRDGSPWGQPQVLMRQLRQVNFRYRGFDEERRLTDWLTQWPWPKRLPESIQISLDADGPVQWPRMTVTLRSSQGKGGLL